MASQNKIVIVGTVESQPDIKATNAGDSISKLTLRVDRPQRQDGMHAGHDSVPVVAWQNLAETAQSINAGDVLLVEGQIQTRNYEDQNGFRVYVTEVHARQLKPLMNSGSMNTTSVANVNHSEGSLNQDNQPHIEPLESNSENKDVSFDFNDHSNNDIIQNAPKFDTPAEDDVPF